MPRAMTLLLAGALILSVDSAAGESKIRLMILPLKAENVSPKIAADVETILRGAFAGDGQLEIVDAPAGERSAAIHRDDHRADPKRISEIAGAPGASRAIALLLLKDDNGYHISAELIDVARASVEYATRESAPTPEELLRNASRPVERIGLFLKGVPCSVRELSASRGSLPDRVRLEWRQEGPCERYAVHRAPAESGDYQKIGESTAPQYDDLTAAPGVKYWYRIAVVSMDSEGGSGESVSGYSAPPQPRTLALDELLREKKTPPERFATREEEQRSLGEREILKRFYMNAIKLRLTMFLARSYLNEGKLIIVRDFDSYRLDPAALEAVFTNGRPAYAIRFKSKRLFSLYAATGPELFDRLMKNAVLYCVRTGDAETPSGDGGALMTPEYAAIGMSTEYLRDDREWSERTIMLGTDDREYKDRIKKAGEAAE